MSFVKRCLYGECETEFEIEKNNRRYCDFHRQVRKEEQRQAEKDHRDRIRREQDKRCKECNKPLDMEPSNRRLYCSVECRNKFYATKPALYRRGYTTQHWICKCGVYNWKSRIECNGCGKPKQ